MRSVASRPSSLAAALAVAAIVACAGLAGCSQLPLRLGPSKPPAQPAPQIQTQAPAPAPAPQAPAPTPVPQPAPVQTQPMPAQAPPPAAPQRDYGTAALLLPLSGPSAFTGEALFNAAQLALFEVADKKFTLFPYDTKGTPEGAAAAVAQAIANRPDIILGPVFSAEAKAAAPAARAAGIPMVTFSADRTVAGAGVYVIGFLPGPQALRAVAFAARKNMKRIAILAPADEYGQRVAEEVAASSAAAGATVVAAQYYDANSTDLEKPIKALTRPTAQNPAGDLGFDALLLPDEGARLRAVAATLPLLGVDPGRVKLLGTMLWADSSPGAEPALAGGWYPAPATANLKAFEDRYQRAFGVRPPRIASLGYDATALAAVLGRKTARDFGLVALTNPSGFAGVDGLFRLRVDGTNDRGYAIEEVVRNGPGREIDPAPTSFSGSGF